MSNNHPQGRPLVPRPPAESKQKGPNLASRRRNLASNDSGYLSSSTFKEDLRKSSNDTSSSSDPIVDLINSPIESRPSSSRLSKYAPLPQIGSKFATDTTKPKRSDEPNLAKTMSNMNLNETNGPSPSSILIGIRLPNGTKKEKTFSNRDTLKSVLEFALKDQRHLGPVANFTILMMPNFVVHDLSKSIGFYKIANRSMLFVIDKKLL